jgi:hypothetical protein
VKKIPEKYYILTIVTLLIALIFTMYGWRRSSREKDFCDEFYFSATDNCFGNIEEQNENVGESEIK